MRRAALVVAVVLGGAFGHAPSRGVAQETALATIQAEGARQAGNTTSDPAPSTSDVRDGEFLRLELEHQKTLAKARIAQANFAIDAARFETTMYAHHQFWTDAAAVMVYLLTGFGVLCSAVQFQLVDKLLGRQLRNREPAGSGNEDQVREPSEPLQAREPSQPLAGTIELPGGAKVASPFLGVVILVISLAFFYLYLAVVYPITASASAPITLQ